MTHFRKYYKELEYSLNAKRYNETFILDQELDPKLKDAHLLSNAEAAQVLKWKCERLDSTLQNPNHKAHKIFLSA